MHLVIYLQSNFVTCELSNFVKAQFGEIGAFQDSKANGKTITSNIHSKFCKYACTAVFCTTAPLCKVYQGGTGERSMDN